MRFDYTPSDVARFWAKVDKTDGCWLWTASRDKDGYGRLQMGERDYVRAHVMSFEIHVGAVGGLWVLHHCDNPPCVRPDHLFSGTASDNSRDRDAKGRNPNSFKVVRQHRYATGERSRSAKLNPSLVREIRARRAAGETYEALGQAYGISLGSAWDVVRRKTWGHVD